MQKKLGGKCCDLVVGMVIFLQV